MMNIASSTNWENHCQFLFNNDLYPPFQKKECSQFEEEEGG